MAKDVIFDISELEKFRDRLVELDKSQSEIAAIITNDISLRLFREILKNSPVDTGWLRENWALGAIKKEGDIYKVEIINPTDYAAYVNDGHATRNRKGWVPGQFFVEISVDAVEQRLEAIMAKTIDNLLRRLG